MKTYTRGSRKSLTLAQICEALAAGLLPAQQENGEYIIRKGDLRRLLEPQPAMVALPVAVPVQAQGVTRRVAS